VLRGPTSDHTPTWGGPVVTRAEAARQRGFEVEVAAFEKWDAASRMFDAVIAGQTWHWIDPVAGAVKAAQVLRPGGRLALFWNVGQSAPEIAAAFAEVYRSIDTGLPFVPFGTPALDLYAPSLPRQPTGFGKPRCSASLSSGASTRRQPSPATSGLIKHRPQAVTTAY
jgi:hypothetical protein